MTVLLSFLKNHVTVSSPLFRPVGTLHRKNSPKLAEKTRWTCWRRLGTRPCYTRRGSSSPCDATTPEGSGPETSRWATWCFGGDKTPEGGTSSRPLGGAIRRHQSSEARNIQAGQQSRRGLQQRLEHPTATPLLPLRCFQVVHTPRLHTPTKSNHQGRVSLAPAKPDPPSGARRGAPPLRQNFPRKKSFCENIFCAFRLLQKWDPENDGVHVSRQGLPS